MELVIASSNKNKIFEINNKFQSLGITFKTVSEFPEIGEIEETGSTFKENALIKARAVCAHTGLTAMADDSGLIVDSLNGEPGVYSARWMGLTTDEEKNLMLLKKLGGLPKEKRTARFVCVIAIVCPDNREFTAEGVCEGLIADIPSGSGGFGYDPVFYVEQLGNTMAQISIAEKNRISHRAKALDSVTDILKAL